MGNLIGEQQLDSELMESSDIEASNAGSSR